MMKTFRTALFATATLTVVTSVAHADSLQDLKSALYSLKSLDAFYQAAVQVPDGFSILPAADSSAADEAPAVEEPLVEVKTSGYIKGGYIYSQVTDGTAPFKDASSDFDGEAGASVKGSVQSSLGEVGGSASIKWNIAESTDNAVTIGDDGFSGFWQFANTMKLDIGRGTGGALENGIGKNTRRLWTVADKRVRQERAGNGFFDDKGHSGFMGLTYASGPITLNVRAHDATRGAGGAAGYDDDAVGVSSRGVITSDMINFEVSGGYWGQDDASSRPILTQTGVKWLAGVGTEINAIQGVTISLAAQTGRLHNDTKTVNVSGSVGFTLTDDINMGIGAGWKRISDAPVGSPVDTNHTERVINGGIYYAPLAQMIIGLEGDWLDDGKSVGSNDGYTGAVVTRYSF